ncbi:MAG: orotate phosphoribosyltransferase [Polyangiaceae bacterium]
MARARLIELLRALSYREGRVVLASGKESDFFIDCKQTVLTAEGHALVGETMLDALLDASGKPTVDAVAGVELGGCPLASAVALTSHLRGLALDAIYVRKEAKDHGSRRLIEGGTRLAAGARVALLEDVITTGGSTLKALTKLREAGFVVDQVVVLVDRLEGGREALEGAGLEVHAITTRTDIMGR